jgi:hypothetical protein
MSSCFILCFSNSFVLILHDPSGFCVPHICKKQKKEHQLQWFLALFVTSILYDWHFIYLLSALYGSVWKVVRAQTDTENYRRDEISAQSYPWNPICLDKLMVTHLVRKFPSAFGAHTSVTRFPRIRHWSHSWAR